MFDLFILKQRVINIRRNINIAISIYFIFMLFIWFINCGSFIFLFTLWIRDIKTPTFLIVYLSSLLSSLLTSIVISFFSFFDCWIDWTVSSLFFSFEISFFNCSYLALLLSIELSNFCFRSGIFMELVSNSIWEMQRSSSLKLISISLFTM